MAIIDPKKKKKLLTAQDVLQSPQAVTPIKPTPTGVAPKAPLGSDLKASNPQATAGGGVVDFLNQLQNKPKQPAPLVGAVTTGGTVGAVGSAGQPATGGPGQPPSAIPETGQQGQTQSAIDPASIYTNLNTVNIGGGGIAGGIAGQMNQQRDSVIQWDQQFLQSPPPGVTDQNRHIWDQQVQTEMQFFNQELAQYPDQFDKIFQNHQIRMNKINSDFTGQYEGQFDESTQRLLDLMNKEGYNIQDPQAVLNNPQFQQALDALKQGKDINQISAGLRATLPTSYDFSIQQGTDPTKGAVDPYSNVNIQTPTQTNEGATQTTTFDKSRLDQLLGSAISNQATQTQMDELLKLINSGQVTPDQVKQYTDQFNQGADKQSYREQGQAVSDLLGQLSARGAGTNLAAVTGGVADVAGRFQEQRDQRRGAFAQNTFNTLAAEQGQNVRSAVAGLGELAARETAARLDASKIISGENIAQAGIASNEKERSLDRQLARDELFQNGQLTAQGQQLQQSLGVYGLNLEKYQTDQGFDLELAKNDLTERLAQAGLNKDAAQLQADNLFRSLDAAVQDKKINTAVEQSIADLQLQAAQGDQDASIKIEGLRTTQDLQRYGIESDIALHVADLYYKLKTGAEQMDFQKWMFLTELNAKLEAAGKGGGLGGFLGGLVGTVVGAAAGGFGGKIGSEIGGKL